MILRKHPPERRRRSVTLAAHGCCCCCCCCLHSLGSLIGSAVASAKAPPTPEARRTVRIYWIAFLLSVATGIPTIHQSTNDNLAVAFVLAAIFLPAGQWLASFLTLSASVIWPIDLPTLGRLTWKGFLWGLVGFVIMAVPLMAMSYM